MIDQLSLFGFASGPMPAPQPADEPLPKSKRTRTSKTTQTTTPKPSAKAPKPVPAKNPPPKDAKEIYLFERWWPIAGKEWYGNACYAKVDMRLHGVCVLPKCHCANEPHWHTWAFDDANSFR